MEERILEIDPIDTFRDVSGGDETKYRIDSEVLTISIETHV